MAHLVGQAVVAERTDVGHVEVRRVARCFAHFFYLARQVDRCVQGIAAEAIREPGAFALQLDHAFADDEDGLFHDASGANMGLAIAP